MPKVKTEPYFVQDDLQDIFLQAGKFNPEVYFNEDVRKGISSFAALSNNREVQVGLKKLKKDLEDGRFTEIRDAYESSTGDYIFVVFSKSN
jgi:hypothetical protein